MMKFSKSIDKRNIYHQEVTFQVWGEKKKFEMQKVK